jgi:hypothetical protein
VGRINWQHVDVCLGEWSCAWTSEANPVPKAGRFGGADYPLEDVEFIAHSREDVLLLLSSLREAEGVSAQRLASVEARAAIASPGPWTAFLESSGGIGGASVIRISESDDEPDMYLWKGGVLAPDADVDFVAHARQDIPRLIELVRSSS